MNTLERIACAMGILGIAFVWAVMLVAIATRDAAPVEVHEPCADVFEVSLDSEATRGGLTEVLIYGGFYRAVDFVEVGTNRWRVTATRMEDAE